MSLIASIAQRLAGDKPNCDINASSCHNQQGPAARCNKPLPGNLAPPNNGLQRLGTCMVRCAYCYRRLMLLISLQLSGTSTRRFDLIRHRHKLLVEL